VEQHALTDGELRCICTVSLQLAVAKRAATEQRRRPAPEPLTVRSRSFADGAPAHAMM